MKYSIIIPVYNRPAEADELLESIAAQKFPDMEVILVDDGSTHTCAEVAQKYAGRLNLKYFFKPNSGPGQSRNYGAERSQGQYFIVLDSDCVLPSGYMQAIDQALESDPCEAFGGPDCAHSSFTPVQKAINYSMTSFFTTGGIRGGKHKMDRFYPRSFNMGIQAALYRRLGGFAPMRFGEDIDFSLRIVESGARSRLIREAWVWHKRRTGFRKFWRQVYNSGMARVNLYKLHPSSLKIVHLLPALFVVGAVVLLALATAMLLCKQYASALAALSPLLLWAATILADASAKAHSLRVGLLSVWASIVQLWGYGCGFLAAWWQRCVLRRKDFSQAYSQTFYK